MFLTKQNRLIALCVSVAIVLAHLMAEAQINQILARQSELEARLVQETAARVANEAVITQLRADAAGAPAAGAGTVLEQLLLALRDRSGTSSNQIIDTRQLGKPDKFDGVDANWSDWNFVAASYLAVTNHALKVMLDTAVNRPELSCENTGLTEAERGMSTQLYYVLVLLTKGRALDKVQAAGEGEGLVAWRLLHAQWEPAVVSRYVGMLMQLLALCHAWKLLSAKFEIMRSKPRTSSPSSSRLVF